MRTTSSTDPGIWKVLGQYQISCGTLSVTALCSTCTDQLPMTEADTPPLRPPLLLSTCWSEFALLKASVKSRDTPVSNYPLSSGSRGRGNSEKNTQLEAMTKFWVNSICHPPLGNLPITFHLIQFVGGEKHLFCSDLVRPSTQSIRL